MADVNADQLLSLLGIDLEAAALELAGEAPLPEPGFVVKTKDDRGMKIFLNVCSSALVPAPPGWRFPPSGGEVPPEVAAYLTTGDMSLDAKKRAEKLLSIPLHTSDPKREVDHSGEECTVVDCVANPNILAMATDFRPLKLFLVQLVLTEAETRLQRQLDPKFKLPRMRCKGSLSPLMIKNSQTAPLETDTLVLPGAARAAAAAVAAVSAPIEVIAEGDRADRLEKNEQDIEYPSLQHSVRYEGRPVNTVVITVELPRSKTGVFNMAEAETRALKESIKVNVAGDIVSVAVPLYQILEVHLPLAVAGGSGGARACISGAGTNKTLLEVRCPWRPFKDVQWTSTMNTRQPIL